MGLPAENEIDHPVSASRRIIQNTFFLAVADVVNKAMMFVFYLVAARHLSVEQFGVLSFATTFVTMWSVFSDLGLGVVSARELARDRIEGRRQVNIALTIKLVATLLVIGLIVAVVNLMNLDDEKIRVVYIATIFVLQTAFTTYFASVFQGVEKMHFTTLSRILQGVVLVAGVFVLRTGPARVESYTWLYVFAGLVSVLFAAGAAYVLVRPAFDFHIKRWWGVLKEALPIGLAIILVSFYYWNGTTFLTKLSGDQAVGAYSAAFRVVWGTLFITLSFSASIYPFFSRLYVADPARLSEVLKQALRYITVLTLPVGGFGTLLAKPIVFLLYGVKYNAAITPFMILVWWSVAASFSSILSNYFIAINRASEMTIQSGLSLGVNLLGNILLIPRCGAIGAAVSITAAEFAGVLYLWLRHLRTPYRVTIGSFMSILTRAIATLVLAGVVAWLLGRYNIWAGVLIGVVLYAFLLMLTGVISKNDINFIQRLVGKRVVKENQLMERSQPLERQKLNSFPLKWFLVGEGLLCVFFVVLSILGMEKLAIALVLAPMQLFIWALLVGNTLRILYYFGALVPVVGAAFLPPSYQQFAFYPVVLLLLGLCYTTSWAKGRVNFRSLSQLERIPIVTLAAVIIFSFVNAYNRGWQGPTLLPTTVLMLELLAIGYLGAKMELDEKEIAKVLRIVIFSTVICTVGIFGLAWSGGVGSDFGSKSVLTPFGWLNLNAWGCIAAVAGIMALVFVLQGKSVLDRVTLGVVIFILMAMLVLTKSRGAWLGFGLALLYVLIVSRSFKLILFLAAVLFVLSLWDLARQLVFTRVSETTLFDPSLAGRFILWHYAWKIGKINWLLGVGMENFRFVKHLYRFPSSTAMGLPFNAHNIYLEFFADLGFGGALAFLAMLVGAVVRSYTTKFDESLPHDARTVGIALSAGIITFMVHGLVDAFTYNPGALSLLIILIGLSSSFWALKKRYRALRVAEQTAR